MCLKSGNPKKQGKIMGKQVVETVENMDFCCIGKNRTGAASEANPGKRGKL